MAAKKSPLELVAQLLAIVASEGSSPQEREAAEIQAHKLMTKHAIDEAELRATQSESERRKPVVEEWEGYKAKDTTFSYQLEAMLRAIAETNRVRAVVGYQKATLVGFSEDVAWVKELFMATQLSLVSQMVPHWNTELTVDHNIYNFKRAGFKWQSIWHTMSGHVSEMPCDRPPRDGGYMIRCYKRHMKLVGDDQPIKTSRHEAFRESFVEGFSDKLISRLRRMAREDAKEASGSGAELALRNVAEDVDTAFYDQFPHMRPMTAEESAKLRAAQEAQWAAEAEVERVRWAGLTEAQKRKELEAQERVNKKNERDWARWDRQRSARYSDEGRSAGSSAASNVSLARTGAKVSTNNRKELN